ncbi:MAG: hypothetical protein PHQ81_10825 [Methanofollis sp.]|nr:hypothetical protein [Methanofollis sp.]
MNELEKIWKVSEEHLDKKEDTKIGSLRYPTLKKNHWSGVYSLSQKMGYMRDNI